MALGIAIVELHLTLPFWLDHLTERVIGLTLILLGVAVIAGIFRPHAHPSRVQSRIAAINLLRTLCWGFLTFFQPGRERHAPFACNYNAPSVFLILHRIGAETPSQLALFFLTAQLGGTAQPRGCSASPPSPSGLILMNTLMTALLSGLFGIKSMNPTFYRIFAWGGSLYSSGIGTLFLAGSSSLLPSLR